jgi:hypothetical protein
VSSTGPVGLGVLIALVVLAIAFGLGVVRARLVRKWERHQRHRQRRSKRTTHARTTAAADAPMPARNEPGSDDSDAKPTDELDPGAAGTERSLESRLFLEVIENRLKREETGKRESDRGQADA